MFKKNFLFATTILTATAVSTGYGSTDSLKGNANAATFLDWFNTAEKYVAPNGFIVLDLIPILFLTIQAILFFKDHQKWKCALTALTILLNLTGALLILQFANPIASEITTWTPEKLPADWTALRNEWLSYHIYRDLFMIFGFTSILMTYFVRRTNS